MIGVFAQTFMLAARQDVRRLDAAPRKPRPDGRPSNLEKRDER